MLLNVALDAKHPNTAPRPKTPWSIGSVAGVRSFPVLGYTVSRALLECDSLNRLWQQMGKNHHLILA